MTNSSDQLYECDIKRWHRTLWLTIVICLQTAAVSRSAEPLAERSAKNVLSFDAGPENSRLGPDLVPLTLSTAYSTERGFGWITPPSKDFNRTDLSRSRRTLTMSGVSGEALKFRADVARCAWHVMLWLEAERPGSTPPRIFLQNKEYSTGWHMFASEAEPRSSPLKTYRVFSGAFDVEDDGAAIELRGGDDEVGLLAISLIKHLEPSTDAHRALLNLLKEAGSLRSSIPLSGLLRKADELLKQSPDDAFVQSWRQRIVLLTDAERLGAMRGWQSSDEVSDLGPSDRLCQAIMLLDGLLGEGNQAAGELMDRALFLRGRLLYWLGKERDEPGDIAAAGRDLSALYRKYPSDELLAMYNGNRVDSAGPCGSCAAPEAPAWSNAQHEVLCRLRGIVRWWVDERQSTDGEFGGKYDDDVELLRWWSPLALAGDETALRGWQRLADGVWQSKHIEQGYARTLRDVEHAAELIADTAPLMAVYCDDRQYLERLEPSARHFEKLWTGVTPAGRRFFRSAWFSASEIDADEPRNRDVEYNTRAARALRYLAWRRGDSEVVKLLHEWSLAWISAAMRTDKGKPRGVIPPSVRFDDEAINGDEATWYTANMGWGYYDWEFNAGCSMLDQLLFTYTLTGDERLLRPMIASLELIKANEERIDSAAAELEKGSAAWAARVLVDNPFFWSVVEQWRFASGDTRWDELIRRYGTPNGRYRITGDPAYLTQGLQHVLDQVRYNTPMRTTEVLFTDRVDVRGWDCVKAMLTGDGMPENASPYLAASWEHTDEGFTALVNENASNKFGVDVFSHSSKDSSVVMRLWNLSPGDYTLRYSVSGSAERATSLRVEQKGKRVTVELPSRRLVRITVNRTGNTEAATP